MPRALVLEASPATAGTALDYGLFNPAIVDLSAAATGGALKASHVSMFPVLTSKKEKKRDVPTQSPDPSRVS